MFSLFSENQEAILDLGKSSINTQNLTVHPTSVRPRQERYSSGNIIRLPKPFEWGEFRNSIDLFLILPVHKQIGFNRAWCNGVYGDIAAAQFIGKDSN